MIKAEEVRQKIISILQRRGPGLPIQIAKEVGMNSLFISAFLSEMVDDKKIRVSSLKVGGSPLYFLDGQESQLENFSHYLHPKEAEAFELIKKNRILKDSEQEPAIRVALRAVKDFAFSFKNDDEVYWRYLSVQEPEIIQIFNSKPIQKKEIKIEEADIQSSANLESSESLDSELTIPKPEIKQRKRIHREQKQEQEEQIELKQELQVESSKINPIFQNPLALEPIKKPKKEKPRSDFIAKTILFLNKNNFRIVEEREYKAKEYNCIVEVNSDLGKILFLTQAKDKKTVTDTELQALLSKSQSIPLPALFLHTGNLSKKAQEYEKNYYSILKTKKIE